jgi:hypothetical protein
MALGIITPGFIKRSASQSMPSSDQQALFPKQRGTQKPANTRRTLSLSSPTPQSQLQLQLPKQRIFSKSFNTQRTQSLSAPTILPQSTQEEQQQTLRKVENARRSQSCSFPSSSKDNLPRSRSTSLQESLKIEDRAHTFGGVPATELTVSGRQFWRSVLGSSARIREG